MERRSMVYKGGFDAFNSSKDLKSLAGLLSECLVHVTEYP